MDAHLTWMSEKGNKVVKETEHCTNNGRCPGKTEIERNLMEIFSFLKARVKSAN